jgi:hypothetical protein
MAYNNFKLQDLENNFHLNIIQNSWIPENLPKFEEDTLLIQTFFNLNYQPLYSKKSRSEYITVPVLQSLKRRNLKKFTIFSGYEFNVDKKLKLQGFCDFIFSSAINIIQIKSPIIFIVEAKRLEPDIPDYAQCGAEMYAAQLFNQKEGKTNKIVYGCATSGLSWGFLKLENNTLTIDPNLVPLTFNNPYNVLATLQWVLDESLK